MKKKTGIFLILFSSIQVVSFLTSCTGFCQGTKSGAVEQPSSASKQGLICKKWRLFKIIHITDVAGEDVDTTTFPVNAKAYQTYLFNNDNTYFMYSRVNSIFSSNDAVNTEEGIWTFNIDSTRIEKKATKYNGQIVNGNMSYSLDRLDISELSITELVFKLPRGSGYKIYLPYHN
jgi:hypothetical protein